MKAPPKAMARSRITNGATLPPGVDGRSTWARRLRDLISLDLSDLGGEDACSEAEKSIIRRAATLTVELERLEATFAKDGQASKDDLDLYQRTAGNLRRLATRHAQIGLAHMRCQIGAKFWRAN